MTTLTFPELPFATLSMIALCAIGCDRDVAGPSLELSRTSSSFGYISQSEVTTEAVATKERELKDTVAKLAQLERTIASTESALAAANEKVSLLPLQIEELRKSLAHLDSSVYAAERQVETARSAYSTFAVTVEQRKAAASTTIAAAANADYTKRVEDIKRARRERDELRVRIGARRDVQSEAQYQAIQVRQAHDNAQQTLAAKIAEACSQIDRERERLLSQYSLAAQYLLTLREQREATSLAIAKKNDELIAQRERTSSLSTQLTHLRNQHNSLLSVKRQQSEELASVQAALRRKNELLVEQRRREDLQRQQALTLATYSSPNAPAATNRTSAPVYPVPYSGNARTTSSYYNYNYRPPVGNHYVRGYVRSDGKFVQPHRRTNPDRSFWNNWSSKGNVNPYTGRLGTKRPPRGY